MFKKTLLTLTALSAISLATVPVTAPADAAVKIKPATVKHNPKVRVAKPKVRVKSRVKVRAANVRVKVRKKVRVKAAKVRVKKPKTKTKTAKLHIKPPVHGLANAPKKPIRIRTIRPEVKVKPDVKKLIRRAPRKIESAKVTAFDNSKLNSPAANNTPAHRGFAPSGKGGQPQGSKHPSFKKPGRWFLADAARFAEVGQAASLAEDLKALQDTLRVAGHSSGELDMLYTPFSPDSKTPENADSNPSGLGNPFLVGAGPQIAGIGSGIFGFLPNSHSKDTPSHSLGINVAGAIGGVASKGDGGKPIAEGKIDGGAESKKDGGYRVDWSYSGEGEGDPAGTPETRVITLSTNDEHGSHQVQTTYGANWERVTTRHIIISPRGNRRDILINFQENTWTIQDSMRSGRVNVRQGRLNDGSYPYPIDQKLDPDYAGGGGCQSMDCILNGRKPKGLTKTDLTPGGLPPAPGESVHTGQPTAPLYTANDVLERYDPDSTDQGGGGSAGKNAAGPGGLPEDPNG